jgi:hypothetical protein
MNYTNKAIKKAYLKIKDHYSNNGKGFIHHLIGAFLPIQEDDYYPITDEKCVITDKLGFCTKTYGEMTYNISRLKILMNIGDEEIRNNIKIEIENIVKEVREHFDIEEGEDIMETRRLFYSVDSDKCLSFPALIALKDFALTESLGGNKIILNILNKKRQKDRIETKEGDYQNNQSSESLGDNPVLQALRAKFK